MITEKATKGYMIKLYIVVIFYQLANALILPIVPYIANNLNASSLEYGLVFTVYYVTQLISENAPFCSRLGSFSFGKVSDMYGRKIALMVSLSGITFCGMLFLSITCSYLLPAVHQEHPPAHCASCLHRTV